MKIILFLFIFLYSNYLLAEELTISGFIKDKITGENLAYSTVVVKNNGKRSIC